MAKPRQVSIRGDTHAKLKAEAQRRNVPITDLLEEIIHSTFPSSGNSGSVFSDPDCIFHYCPTPNICERHGCQHRFAK